MNKNTWSQSFAAVMLAALLLWYQQLPAPMPRAASATLHSMPKPMPINNHNIAR